MTETAEQHRTKRIGEQDGNLSFLSETEFGVASDRFCLGAGSHRDISCEPNSLERLIIGKATATPTAIQSFESPD